MPAAGSRHPKRHKPASRGIQANDVVAGAENDFACRQDAIAGGAIRDLLQFADGAEEFHAEGVPALRAKLFANVASPPVKFGTLRQQPLDGTVSIPGIVRVDIMYQ